jgi:hypothetical protein
MSGYLPDGCTQDALDRYLDGDEDPFEYESQEEEEMPEEPEYICSAYEDDTTKATCGHWDSESHLTYLPNGDSLCAHCALYGLRKPASAEASAEAGDGAEREVA